jgi:hypothetical protein
MAKKIVFYFSLKRFMYEIADYIGVDITRKVDGRTPEEVFIETRFLGNSRLAKCSSELKVRHTVIFIEELRDKGLEPILYFGIGPHEKHRVDNLTDFYGHQALEPVETRFPLVDGNIKDLNLKKLIENDWGIQLPRMYELGFSHANCGGRCVRGGFNHYHQLYKIWPEVYKEQEEMENKLRDQLGDVAILKRDGKPFTLEEYRKELMDQNFTSIDLKLADDTVPCVCAV